MSAASTFRHRIDSVSMTGAAVLAMNGVIATAGGNGNVLIRCPAHDDEHPSCSVHLGTGKSHCFGCGWSAGDVVALHRALGGFATMGDALRDLESRVGMPMPRLRVATAGGRRGRGDSDRPVGDRVVVKTWVYHLADGVPAFQIDRLQWRLPDGEWFRRSGSEKPHKVYLPKAPGSTTYGMPTMYSSVGSRPLYALPDLLASDVNQLVYVVEGEPAADALRSIGWVATTSSSGSSSSAKTEWSPLAGRRVVLWPDNDQAGRRYAADVHLLLVGLVPPAQVQVVDVAALELPAGGDAVDWLRIRVGGRTGP